MLYLLFYDYAFIWIWMKDKAFKYTVLYVS